MTSRNSGHKPDEHDQATQEETGSTQSEKIRSKKPPRPSQCRTYTREAVAESIPDIVDTFVSEAMKGSVPHFNLLTKFGGFDHRPLPAPTPRRRKSFASRLLDDMKQHQAKIVAANEARAKAEGGTGQ